MRKEKKQIERVSDEELVEAFNQTSSAQEKLQYFSIIQNSSLQIQLLDSIPGNEKYKFIGKIRSTQGIAQALNGLGDDETKRKTFNFIAKQFKGNDEGLLRILTQIDFDITIPPDMRPFRLNSIKNLNLDFLISLQRHVNNYTHMKFVINGEDYSRDTRYSFGEISAIIAKIEELTADIPQDMEEADKFYTIYSRITGIITYDHQYIRENDKLKVMNDKRLKLKTFDAQFDYELTSLEAKVHKLYKAASGLYGGLVNGKSVCAGYALILHEALKYVGMKSLCVVGYGDNQAHAWNQVKIDGKWYNADPTWDATTLQNSGKYECMLLNNEDFDKTHKKFPNRARTYHKCKDQFDYSKINGLAFELIMPAGRSGYCFE